MKQETTKKSKLWLWLVIGAVALLAVAGVVLALVLGGSGAQDEGPKGGRPEIYWNVDKLAYTKNSESGLSTREPGEDGLYHVRFAYNGELVEMAVIDKPLINYIDTLDAMGLVRDADGVVIDVIDAREVATEKTKNTYVKSSTATTITINSSIAMNGMVTNLELCELTEIYDVTPGAEQPGKIITTADLLPMDTLTVYANDMDQVTHVYITNHPKQSKVYWRAVQSWNSKLKETARVPDENGVYTIPFFCEGELVELKTKDKTIATKVDSVSRYSCHFGFEFDEEGYIVEQFSSALGISAVLTCERWDIISIEGETVTIQRLLTNDGSMWTGTVPADCVVYDVSNVAKAEGRQGKQVDGLKVGDRVCLWSDTNGTPVLAYVSNRLADSPAYYIPSTKYSSAKKETTREPNWQGYYEIELVKEGTNATQVYYVKDKEVMNFIDSQNTKCVGLKVGEGNIVEFAYDSEAITGYSCATRGGVTTAVTGGIFTKITYGQRGTEVNFVQAPGCRIYNMSTYGNYGEETTLRPGDHIYGYRQPSGEILLIYVVKRQIGVNSIYYNLERKYNSTTKETTREPDADGWYVFTLGHNGKEVTLRTKNKTLASKVDSYDPCAMVLEVSGDVILKSHDPTYACAGAKTASGYRYQGINAEGLHYATYTNSTTGKTTTNTFKMAENCKIYNVSSVFDNFKGERVYSIKQNDMLTVYTNWYGEAEIIYIRGRDVENMYWKTEMLYDSTNKVTKREPDADGYYWYELAVNGECKTFKTKDQKVANSMDSYAGAFGLRVKGDEILSFVSTSNVKNVKGNGVISYVVTAINGKTVTLTYNKPGSNFGKTETIKLSSSTKIFDVSPSAMAEGKFGAAVKLQVGDTIRSYLSRDGVTHSYVYIQAHSTRKGGEVGYCEVCKKEVTWNPVLNSANITAADGHWYVTADTISFVQHTFDSSSKNYTICLDLNGHTLSRTENGRLFRVASGETLNVFDSVGGGKLVTGGGTGFSGGMMMVSSGAKFNMYSGTMEFVQGEIKNGYGGNIYATGTNTEINIYGGTITGGTTYSQGSNKSGFGGNIYAQSKATVNLYGGVVEKGRAVSDVYEKATGGQGRGGASGGNIHVESGAILNIYEGAIIRDGVADQYGGNINQRDTKSGTQYAVINMYGGQILNGQCDAEGKGTFYGGNISAYGDMNLMGGLISGGKQGTNDYDVYIYSKDSVGTVEIGSVQVDGKLRVNQAKSVTLSGAPKLAQLNLYTDYKVIVGELTEGADIKVQTTASTPIFTTPFDMANDYLNAGYFKAYDESMEIRVTGNNELAAASAGAAIDPNTVYTAAKAMSFANAAADGKVTAKCPVCNKSADWYPLGVVNEQTNNTGKTSIDNIAVKVADGQHYHYYLSESVDYTQNTGFYYFGGETKVCLNLNGQTIQSARRAFYTETTGTVLNIMGEGIVRGNGTESANSGIIDAVRVVNLYGGTYESTGTVSAALSARGTNAACVVSIYEGTTLRATNGAPTVILPNTTVAGVAATININGGNVEGKVVLGHAKGTINLSGSPVISDLDLTAGHKVNVGELVTGAEIHVTANGIFTAERSDIGSVREYFHSNVSGKDIIVEAGALSIGEKKEVICAHCGKTEAELEAAGTPWTPWTAAYGSSYKGTIQSGHYYLTESDLSMNAYFYIGASTTDVAGQGVDVVLDMRGFSLKSTSRVFYTYQNNDLTIMDSVGGSTITGGLKNHGGVIFFGDGKYEATGDSAHLGLYGIEVIDAVTDTRKDHTGGAIQISSYADMTMEDCTVTGLSAKVGTAVYASHGVITMRNCTINGGTAAEKAGAIYINKGTLNLENTTVNSGTAPFAPGIEVITGTLNVNGGNIGDVWMHEANSTANISGAAVIGTLDLTNKNAKINVGELTQGASITVVANGVFTNDLTDPTAVKDFFHSGVAKKEVVVEGNALTLAKVEAPAPEKSIYEQAKEMDFSAGGTVNAVCPVCGTAQDWTALPAAGTARVNIADGAQHHYYLDPNVDYTKAANFYYIKSAVKVCLNLNGQNMASTNRVFVTESENTVLNIMGEGTVTGAPTQINRGVLDATAEMNLYGGTYECTNSAAPVLAVRASKDYGIVNIYEGTIIQRPADAPGLNVYIVDNGELNLYGGIIRCGDTSADDNIFGGNIWVNANASNAYTADLNVYGGTIECGKDLVGGNIYVSGNDGTAPSATVTISGGKILGNGVFATGANASINISGNPVVDYLEMKGANLVNVADMTEGADITVMCDLGEAFTNAIAANADAYAAYFHGEGAHTGAIVKDNALQLADICPHCGVSLAEITWAPLNKNADNSAITMAESGHYRLAEDLDSTSNTISFKDASTGANPKLDVVIDTAGFDISGGGRAVYVNKGHTFTIFDSVGGSELNSHTTNTALGGSALYAHAGTTVNIYDLTLNACPSVQGNGACVSVYGADAVVNVYSGTFNGNVNEKSGATGGTINCRGTLNIYGGTFNASTLPNGVGSCIYVYKTGKLNVSGGVLNGDVYVDTDGKMTVVGAPLIENVVIKSGVKITLEELAEGADITVSADGEFAECDDAQTYVDAGYIKAAAGKKITVDGVNLSMSNETVLQMLAAFLGL